MKRIELDDFLIDDFRNELTMNARSIFDLYQSNKIEAKLYELGNQGITIEIYWTQYDQTEFINLDRREGNNLDTFVWAFADFEWLVIDNDDRQLLQLQLDEFNSL